MKTIILLFACCAVIQNVSAQKSAPDTALFFNWPSIKDWHYPAISNNGRYAMYTVSNGSCPACTLHIHTLKNSREILLPGAEQPQFTNDSRHVIFISAPDSLFILTIRNNSKRFIARTNSFKYFASNSADWLLYQDDNERSLTLLNLKNNNRTVYPDVDQYTISKSGTKMVLTTFLATGTSNIRMLKWVALSGKETKEIWTGKSVNNVCFNDTESGIAFLGDKSIWRYEAKAKKATELINADSLQKNEEMEVTNIIRFTKNGQRLFVSVKSTLAIDQKKSMSAVNIWSYQDPKLQSQQLEELHTSNNSLLAVINIQLSPYMLKLQTNKETVLAQTDKFVLLKHQEGERSEIYWNKSAHSSTCLLLIKNNRKIPIPVSRASISPMEKFVIGNGTGINEVWGSDFFSYEIANGMVRNITVDLPIPLYDEESEQSLAIKGRGLKVAGWLKNDTALLIYDNYDIWRIDPLGKQKPVNLTQGRITGYQFRLASEEFSQQGCTIPDAPLLLTAFNKKTKELGFYKFNPYHVTKLVLLSKGDFLMETLHGAGYPSCYIKARAKNVYLIKKEQSTQSPNIFSTTDFKTFSPISNVYPEKKVNWFTAELVNFTTLDGIESQAILYKPENIDTSRKNPLIVHYYEKKSDELNRYPHPVVADGGDVDIAWFASHGYLVLLPDIHYQAGKLGENIYNSVVGAVEYICKRPYVDENRIGIQGHSFGGYETNYLITHTDLFSAAVSSSGIINIPSDFGSLWGSNKPKQAYWEMERNMEGTPWQNPENYVKNSPIFDINKVTFPLMLVNNLSDKNVHYEQGLEFFNALRRARKNVWMLEYDNAGHGVGGNPYKDYLLRMNQFFGHYLRDAAIPLWIQKGIPASLKGMQNGFQLQDTIIHSKIQENNYF